MYPKREKGIALAIVLGFVLLLVIATTCFMLTSLSEIKMVRRQNNSTRAFYAAEAGIQKAIWVISENPTVTDNALAPLVNANNTIGNGGFQVTIATSGSTKTITSTGTVSSINRQIKVDVQHNNWLNKTPGAVYSQGVVKIKVDKRDPAYITGGAAGTGISGIYGLDEVKAKKEGEGYVLGDPGILENQAVPAGLADGIWDSFDFNALREKAKASGTYFSADETADAYNNPYNKKGKYTLPVTLDDGTIISDGVFFFDAKKGEPLDDDEVQPKNEIRVKLQGTNAVDPATGEPVPVSGVIVVVGDLSIKDTNNYDFLFDGVILVLDDLKIYDKKTHRRSGANDSDILINGAVLSDNIIEKGKGRKKKSTIDITNATITYDENVIKKVSTWNIVRGTWQEI